MFSQRTTSFLVLSVSFLATLLFTYLLYVDIHTKTIGAKDLELAGRIVSYQQNVKRKFGDSFLWDPISTSDTLYWSDSIQTYDGSNAEIQLSDGLQFTMSASSLIVLDRTSFGLDLALKTGRVVFSKGGKKDLKLNGVDMKASQSETLAVQTEGETGKTVAIKGDETGATEKLEFSEKGDVVKTEIPFSLLTPIHFSSHVTTGSKASVEFSWKNIAPGARIIELSFDDQFKKLAHRTESSDENIKLQLKPAHYYWRVGVINKSGQTSWGEIREVTVVKSRAPELIAPSDKEKFALQPDAILRFEWSASPGAKKYGIQLSKDTDFEDIILEHETKKTQWTPSELKPGEYHWRVLAKFDNSTIQSQVASIDLFKLNLNTLQIERILPLAKQKINFEEFNKHKGIVFQWKNPNEISLKFVLLDSQSVRADPVFEITTNQNQAVITDELEPGEYYWAIFPAGRKLQSKDLVAIELEPLSAPPESIVLNFPKADHSFAPGQAAVFEWDKIPSGYSVKLHIVSISDELEKIVYDESQADTQKATVNLADGEYVARLTVTDKFGRASKSVERRFQVTPEELLEAPELLTDEVQ